MNLHHPYVKILFLFKHLIIVMFISPRSGVVVAACQGRVVLASISKRIPPPKRLWRDLSTVFSKVFSELLMTQFNEQFLPVR